MLIAYKALIRSVIAYGSMAYDSAAAKTEKLDDFKDRPRGSVADRYLEQPEHRCKWNAVNQHSASDDDDVYSSTTL